MCDGKCPENQNKIGKYLDWPYEEHICTLHNAPSTFQQLMTAIFWEFLRRFVHVYLDDIFIYSQSIREHIEHIMKVLQWLKESQFYLSKSKLDLFSDKTNCLGHVIDDNGIHAKLDKMWQIREWRIPQISWTSAIPGTIHARYNGIYHKTTKPSSEHHYWINAFKALRW